MSCCLFILASWSWSVAFKCYLMANPLCAAPATLPCLCRKRSSGFTEIIRIFHDIVVYEISPMLTLPCLAGRISVIVRRQERRMNIQMRQVRFNRQVEPGSKMSVACLWHLFVFSFERSETRAPSKRWAWAKNAVGRAESSKWQHRAGATPRE